MMKSIRTLVDPLVENNPVTVHVLGICSALAVTTSMTTALTMSIALTVVIGAAAGLISLIRNHIPGSIRLIIQITIIASLVIVADQVLRAFAYDISQRLTVFVSLIATNCIVLGRTEAFAMHNPPLPSMIDGIGNGAGYSAVLLIVAFLRELLGAGSLFGANILPLVADGGWYQPMRLMLLAPSAFIILGLLIWIVRSLKPEQVEAREFDLRHKQRAVET
jgi:Na+-transporting NADH:ubiquinone oxidoreductase subunit D